ncbi:olfactory receptor 7A10-like [Neofelis nebulosa]|uniref:olfactory receptor 7A10-like n=1 Tax=Neofelis nebulosa TaxID=61452 RepID=UPI00272991FA|nr:olfactory receptor 7A10-like [Neofelis nebulosa]
MYLIIVFGNLLIVLAVSSDSHLHTPMYFFLANLSFVDICFTSTVIPKMLWNIQTQSKVITYAGCITQMYFFLLFVELDIFLLTVMAYDRFVAICHPLNYMVIMNPRLCGLLVLVSWIMFVSLFYCTGLGVYLSSAATQSSHSSATASVVYTVVTPMLNPFIYSLRNKDMKGVFGNILSHMAKYPHGPTPAWLRTAVPGFENWKHRDRIPIKASSSMTIYNCDIMIYWVAGWRHFSPLLRMRLRADKPCSNPPQEASSAI